MSPPLVLPRLSGSTLEPTVEPLVIYPQHIHQKEPLAFKQPRNINITYTHPSASLQRKGRPTFIHIPAECKEFVPKEPDVNDFSAWSYDEEDDSEPELLWDDVTQTIYKSSNKRRANSYSSLSVSSDGSPFFPPV